MKKLITIPEHIVEPLLIKAAKEYKGNFHAMTVETLSKSIWINAEDKLPEREVKDDYLSSTSKVVQVKSVHFSEPFAAFYNHNQNFWVIYPYLSGNEVTGITEWRYF